MQFRQCRRRKGFSVIYFVLVIVVILFIAALAVDMGYLYRQRAQAQTAADAAALAGAVKLPNTDDALAAARQVAAYNGYIHGQNGVVVEGTWNPDGQHQNWYQVRVSRPEVFFFGRVLGLFQRPISAVAIAEYNARQPIRVWGVGSYGIVGPQALEISGPYARKSAGDPYSTRFLDNGQPNPEYDPEGYNYWLYVPPNYQSINGTSMLKVEFFDITSGTYRTYVRDNDADGRNDEDPTDGRDNDGDGFVDEDRPNDNFYWQDEVYSYHGVSAQATTVVTIYAPDNTPNDYSDDVVIATVTINPGDPQYRLKWVSPLGFTFNTQTYGTGNYRVNVKTTAGSGGNAYHMRAGPPNSRGSNFNPNNGTEISAIDHLQMFFQFDGTVTWTMGYIPREAAGMRLHIRKFDTDIGAVSVNYTDSTGQINWQGQLSTNGTWKEDVFTVPSNYQGGILRATYQAGTTDTSVWEMWYEGYIEGRPASLRLVR